MKVFPQTTLLKGSLCFRSKMWSDQRWWEGAGPLVPLLSAELMAETGETLKSVFSDAGGWCQSSSVLTLVLKCSADWGCFTKLSLKQKTVEIQTLFILLSNQPSAYSIPSPCSCYHVKSFTVSNYTEICRRDMGAPKPKSWFLGYSSLMLSTLRTFFFNFLK